MSNRYLKCCISIGTKEEKTGSWHHHHAAESNLEAVQGSPRRGGRKLPWMGAHASRFPTGEGTEAWLSWGSVSCVAAKSPAFGSSLTLLWVIYHPTIFFSFSITSVKQQIFPSSFSNPALAVCFQAAVWATCVCSSVAAQWRELVPLSPSLSAGWCPFSSASSPSFFWGK